MNRENEPHTTQKQSDKIAQLRTEQDLIIRKIKEEHQLELENGK